MGVYLKGFRVGVAIKEDSRAPLREHVGNIGSH